jgi:hypothetical protein
MPQVIADLPETKCCVSGNLIRRRRRNLTAIAIKEAEKGSIIRASNNEILLLLFLPFLSLIAH